MRLRFVGFLVTLLSVVIVGCNRPESPRGGPGTPVAPAGTKTTTTTMTTTPTGPGTVVTTTTPVVTPPTGTATEPGINTANTFRIENPGTTKVRQGEAHKVTVTIDRGREFKQAVKLMFKADKGLTVEPANAEVPMGSNRVDVSVQADAGATVGAHTVEIMAMPTTGDSTKLNMAVEVTEKK